jgi:hypothetical protein
MFIKVKDFIINTDHITHAEWRRINVGSPSETRNLHIHFAFSAANGSLSLREDEEVKMLWEYLEKQCQGFGR